LGDAIEPHAYAALRIIAGAMLFCHGWAKLFGGLGMPQPEQFSQLWIGGVIELCGGGLVAVGLFTRCAAFLCSGLLAVAYFQFHWKLHGGLDVLPLVNKGELAVVYCFVFFFIFARGPGAWSLDGLRSSRRGTASRAG
jgi:putative oxidoreductase